MAMKRGSEPVGVSATRGLQSPEGAPAELRRPPCGRRAGRSCAGPAESSCPARSCGCTIVSMALGFAATTTPGWPSTGQRCRLEASSGFSRRPRSQHIFEGLPRPALWTRPLSSPWGGRRPGERGIGGSRGLGACWSPPVSSPQGWGPSLPPHQGPVGRPGPQTPSWPCDAKRVRCPHCSQ